MAALLFVLVLSCFLSRSDQQEQSVSAQPGDDVTLPCRAPGNIIISAVQWIRSGLERHVFVKSDGRVETADQDPSYKNRVQLEDDEMKNGDLSLVLKKVTSNDGGRYECLYVEEGGGARKSKPISVVQLNVTGPGGGDQGGGGQTGGRLGVILSVTLTVLVLTVAGLGFVIYKKHRGRSESNPVVPGDDPDVPNTSDTQVKNFTETETEPTKV